MISHNVLAFLGLIAVFPAAFILSRKRPPHQVLALVAMTSSMYGPAAAFVKLPLLPSLDKVRMTALALLLVALVKWRAHIGRAGWFTVYEALVVFGFVGNLITAMTNSDSLSVGLWWEPFTLPGMVMRDGIHDGLLYFLHISVPFLLGRWLLRRPEHMAYLLKLLVLNGLIQGVFVLIEHRMSPVVHQWFWGYSAIGERFDQAMRWGGWRPNAFTSHGLTLAMFMFMAWGGAILLARWEPRLRVTRYRVRIGRVAWVLTAVLVLCKSTGALFYAAVLGPLVRWGSARSAINLAVALAVITAIYPVLRSQDVIPVDDIVTLMNENIGEERAQSLEFRFVNERGLMDYARKRYWFGWGSYGRQFDYATSHEDTAYIVVDGYWVLVFGNRGMVGFIHSFGLLVLPILVMLFAYKQVADERLRAQVAGFTLIVAFQVFDFIPNGLDSILPYLLAGAVAGFAGDMRRPGSEWRTTASSA